MGLGLTIAIVGVEKLVKDFQKKKGVINNLLVKAIEKGAFEVEKDAKIIAPVDTNYLRSNISHEMVSVKGKPVARIGVNDIVDYAAAVEFMADKGIQPRKAGKRIPFLYPSLQKNEKFINELIKEATIKGLKA